MSTSGGPHDTPTLQLLGGPASPFVRKVAMLVIEKHLEHRVVPLRAPSLMVAHNLQLMTLNPLSKIPTLVREDGSVLYDSDVICDYLDHRYQAAENGPALLPARGGDWELQRWNALCSGMLDILVLWRFERTRPEPQRSAEVMESYALRIEMALTRIETDLAAVQAMPFNLVHLSLGSLFGYLDFRFADLDWRARYVRSAEWFARFMQRESAQRTVPYEGAAPARHFWP